MAFPRRFTAEQERDFARFALLLGALIVGLSCGEVAYRLLHGTAVRIRVGPPFEPVWFRVAAAGVGVFIAIASRNRWLRVAFVVFAVRYLIDVAILAVSVGPLLFAILMIVASVSLESKLRTWPWRTAVVIVAIGGAALRYAVIAHYVSVLNAARPR